MNRLHAYVSTYPIPTQLPGVNNFVCENLSSIIFQFNKNQKLYTMYAIFRDKTNQQTSKMKINKTTPSVDKSYKLNCLETIILELNN